MQTIRDEIELSDNTANVPIDITSSSTRFKSATTNPGGSRDQLEELEHHYPRNAYQSQIVGAERDTSTSQSIRPTRLSSEPLALPSHHFLRYMSYSNEPPAYSDPAPSSSESTQYKSLVKKLQMSPVAPPTFFVSQTTYPSSNPTTTPALIPNINPFVVRQDHDGVVWIIFEYSRDHVKTEYTIRCDIESVDTDSLSTKFKTENCIYPRAYGLIDQYKGNRLYHEIQCNRVGWALVERNPPLRGNRGLIQRAVDFWCNSNEDLRPRVRRLHRMAKINSRKAMNTAQRSGKNFAEGPGSPSPAEMPSSRLATAGPRQPCMSIEGSRITHDLHG